MSHVKTALSLNIVAELFIIGLTSGNIVQLFCPKYRQVSMANYLSDSSFLRVHFVSKRAQNTCRMLEKQSNKVEKQHSHIS